MPSIPSIEVMRAQAPRVLRNTAISAGVGLVGFYAYGTAKYRRNARITYDFVATPAPGTDEFNRLLTAIRGRP